MVKKKDIKKRLIDANRVFGGTLVNKSNLDFELEMIKNQDKHLRKAAHITRAMTSGHAFSDGNKRTAIVGVTSEFYNADLKADKKKLVKTMINLSKTGEGSIIKIERKLRRCTRK